MMSRHILLLLVLALVPFAGCLEGATPGSAAQDAARITLDVSLPPEIAIPDVIRDIQHIKQAVDADGKPAPTSAGADVYGHYAYLPGGKTGFYVVDIIDPA